MIEGGGQTWISGEDLGGEEEREIVIRIYCMKRFTFSLNFFLNETGLTLRIQSNTTVQDYKDSEQVPALPGRRLSSEGLRLH